MYDYILPDQEYRLKAVLRGLPVNFDPEIIKDALTSRNFEIIKIFQMGKWKPIATFCSAPF